MAKQPSQPDLIGSSMAAEILGVQKPHVTRLRRQGRMPPPVNVAGSNDVYVRSEVVALAAELEREREQRAKGSTDGGA
jgi:predicted DNA-binding transcriptional regulator AlpA